MPRVPARFPARFPAPLVVALALAAACGEPAPAPGADVAPACDPAAATALAERLGERLKRVSLLAPDSVRAREITGAYSGLVTPELLAGWLASPETAPGRAVSSPWPERIEVDAVEPAGPAACLVEGEIVYRTSAEPSRGGAAARVPVTLRVVADGGWRVDGFEAGAPTPPPDSTSASAAAAVVHRYYAAIAARDYPTAHALWDDGGAASGQSLEEFAAGFARTARVAVETGEPGRIEGAAGSRYVRVPVVVRAETEDGETQRFEGSYTLRRGVVDGAPAEQRRWHLHTAELVRVP